ncbi:MAG: divergent PAP2 family protein [Alicyclobacillaceae bacterium]|nr:divergent PAP2 family protein [Alicyclobacillaceae bacterium]
MAGKSLLFGAFFSAWFAVAIVSSVVVMYDAVGVRRDAGEQAMIWVVSQR